MRGGCLWFPFASLSLCLSLSLSPLSPSRPASQVVAGRSHVTTAGRIEEPEVEALLAAGLHSVDAQPGGELNYDELVVYDQEQAVPNFLIVYALD